ncbi:hypothetical protein [Winogradskyella endarachnes]|uniref:O-antigen ligase domain-containing protein n=1 Tax=Winogradskyella endarachnes TaxID=2681965 RepID=A0A6L6UC00_9FLAO|nr:hypothetical protein [Winogradskyella endarachnes]MUU79056.1 hypothetical protein [Winogradskyella endarachnes]
MLNTSKLFKLKRPNPNLRLVIPSLLILGFYFSEFVSKYLKYSYYEFTRVSGVIKLIAEVLLLIYIFKFKKESGKNLIKIIAIFTVFYFFGQYFLLRGDFLNRTILNVYTLNSYMFIFVLYFALEPNSKHNLETLRKQLNYLDFSIKSIFVINAIAIFTGLIFDLDLFKSYLGFSNRFGYNGFFLHASHSSYIYIIFILYFFSSYLKTHTTINFYFLIASVVISFLIGTKTVYLFNLLFLLYVLFAYIKRAYALLILTTLGLLFVFTFSNSVMVFRNNFQVLNNVYENHGITTMLFSYRDLNVTHEFIPYILKNWNFFNYIFGGAEFHQFRTEIEIIDLIWFLGVAGTLLYLTLLYNKILSQILKIKTLKLPIIIFLFCALLSGSFFTNVPIIPYLIIFYFSVTVGYGQTVNNN